MKRGSRKASCRAISEHSFKSFAKVASVTPGFEYSYRVQAAVVARISTIMPRNALMAASLVEFTGYYNTQAAIEAVEAAMKESLTPG